MQCEPAQEALERFRQETKARVLEHAEQIAHVLYCERCAGRELALYVLSSISWTEDEFIGEAIEHVIRAAEG